MDGTLVVVSHRDTDGDHTHPIVSSIGSADGPDTADDDVVIYLAEVSATTVRFTEQSPIGESVVVEQR